MDERKPLWPNRRQWARLIAQDVAIVAAFLIALAYGLTHPPDDRRAFELIAEKMELER